MTTGMFRVDRFLFKRAVASSPFIPGKRRSIMIRSGCRLEALSYGLLSRSGFEDFVAQTFDRHPECLSTGIVVVSDQYFLSCVPHIGGKSTRDASQRKKLPSWCFLPGNDHSEIYRAESP